MTRRIELIATSAFGLEAVVARELNELGYTEQKVEDGRVTFIGDELAICRCNLWLRAADRVLVKVGQFRAPTLGHFSIKSKIFPGTNGCLWMPSFRSPENRSDRNCITNPRFNR